MDMIRCKSILPDMPEISFDFTEDVKRILSEAERFAQMQLLQLNLYVAQNVDWQDITLTYDIEGEIRELKISHSKKVKTGGNTIKSLQKELLFNILTGCQEK